MEHHLQVTQLEDYRVVLGAVLILPTNSRAVVRRAVAVTFVRAMNPSDQEAQFIQHLLGT